MMMAMRTTTTVRRQRLNHKARRRGEHILHNDCRSLCLSMCLRVLSAYKYVYVYGTRLCVYVRSRWHRRRAHVLLVWVFFVCVWRRVTSPSSPE